MFGYGGNRFGTPSQYPQSTLDKEFNSPLVIYPNLFCSDIINDIGLAVNEDKGFQLGDVYKLRPIGKLNPPQLNDLTQYVIKTSFLRIPI